MANRINPNQMLDWSKLLELPFKTTKDTNLRCLQMRINYRILGTNYLLLKMKLTLDDKCTFCRLEKETIKHMFWDCESVSYFWEGLQFLLRENYGLENIIVSATDVIFGNPNFENLLNEILLLGRRFTYRMKIEKKRPVVKSFQKYFIFSIRVTSIMLQNVKLNISLSKGGINIRICFKKDVIFTVFLLAIQANSPKFLCKPCCSVCSEV